MINYSQVFYAYTYSTGAWLGLQGVSLMAMPRIIATMLLAETRPPTREHNLP